MFCWCVKLTNFRPIIMFKIKTKGTKQKDLKPKTSTRTEAQASGRISLIELLMQCLPSLL